MTLTDTQQAFIAGLCVWATLYGAYVVGKI
mgnify:CR=1 FL=1